MIQRDQQLVYRKNIGRLVQQNRQLHQEIFRLDSKVNILLSKKLTNDFQQTENEKKFQEKHKEQTKEQVLQIQKLKKKVLLLKNIDKPQQKQDLRREIDQLKFLKNEKEKFIKQKIALQRKCKLKDSGIELNKPIQEEREILVNSYKQKLRENHELRAQIVKIERQILNFHKIKSLAKTSIPKLPENTAFEISSIQNEMNRLKTQLRLIEKEWQPKLESLDTQFFILKEIKDEKRIQINEIEKLIINQKNRMLPMKEQSKIMENKQRVSQVIISSEKRTQIEERYKEEKNKKEFFQNIKNKFDHNKIKQQSKIQQKSPLKHQKAKYTSEFKQNIIKLNDENARSEQLENQNEFHNIEKLNITSFSVKNQFSPSKQDLQKNKLQPIIEKVSKKLFESVGVGTTFYYNENQQIENEKV